MSSITIDPERLSDSLQRGLGQVEESAAAYLGVPKRYRLRVPVCGVVSVALAEHLNDRGVSTSLQLSTPALEFDEGLKHVVPVIEDGGDPLVIDASYSQFLDFVGLDHYYETFTGQQHFPETEVISFRFSERDIITGWLADVAASFQSVNTMPEFDDGMRLGRGPLVSADRQTLQQTYDRIWNPANFSAWKPGASTLNAGRSVAGYIDPRAIEIS